MATFLFSRLFLWLTKKIGDNAKRIFIAHGLCYGLAIIAGSYGFANGGPPNPLIPVSLYTLPQLIWLAVDLFALKGRRGKSASSTPTSP